MAMTKPWISSVTFGPDQMAPSNFPVLASKIVLTRPSGSPSAMALPLPMNGKPAHLQGIACSLACLGEADAAICGGNRCSPGFLTCHRMGIEAFDRLDANTPSCSALWASSARLRHRDAKMPGTLVRPKPSMMIVPRSTFTPSSSSPGFDIADHADGRDQAVGVIFCTAPLPSSIAAVPTSAPFSTAVTLAPVKILIPLLEALAGMRRAISASSTGRICGSTSTTVTSAPSVR